METNQVSPGITPIWCSKKVSSLQCEEEEPKWSLVAPRVKEAELRIQGSQGSWNCRAEYQRDCCPDRKDLHKESSGGLQRFPLEDWSAHACAEKPGKKSSEKSSWNNLQRSHRANAARMEKPCTPQGNRVLIEKGIALAWGQINPRRKAVWSHLNKLKSKLWKDLTASKQLNCIPDHSSRILKGIKIYPACTMWNSQCLASNRNFQACKEENYAKENKNMIYNEQRNQ